MIFPKNCTFVDTPIIKRLKDTYSNSIIQLLLGRLQVITNLAQIIPEPDVLQLCILPQLETLIKI